MNEHFYATLPSNANEGSSASCFTVTLPQRLNLIGEWAVGLTEIIYVNTWYNVTRRDEMNYIKVGYVTEQDAAKCKHGEDSGTIPISIATIFIPPR